MNHPALHHAEGCNMIRLRKVMDAQVAVLFHLIN